jgi:hypothetical protein
MGLLNHCTDTAENWSLENPLIPAGVLCLEKNGSTIKIKIGDGVSRWNTLPYQLDSIPIEATETILGSVYRATSIEALLGLNPNKYISPNTLKYVLDNGGVSPVGIILTPGSNIYKGILGPETHNNTSYTTLNNYGSPEPESFGSIANVVMRMEHKGSATFTLTHRRYSGSGTLYGRIAKNTSVQQEWSTTSGANIMRTRNISFVPGDIITIQGRSSSTSTYGELSNCVMLIENIV